jgi:hypothetical protein
LSYPARESPNRSGRTGGINTVKELPAPVRADPERGVPDKKRLLNNSHRYIKTFVAVFIILNAWDMGESIDKSLDDDRKPRQDKPEEIKDIFRLCSSLDKISIALTDIADALRRRGT